MKKSDVCKGTSEMRAEYDLGKGVRGKYAEAYAKGTNVIVLDPDVAAMFPDSKSVNEALRIIARLASKRAAKADKAPASPTKRKAS